MSWREAFYAAFPGTLPANAKVVWVVPRNAPGAPS